MSVDLYFGPELPEGAPESNWVKTVPGKGWFTLFRLYSPKKPFFDQSWKPEILKKLNKMNQKLSFLALVFGLTLSTAQVKTTTEENGLWLEDPITKCTIWNSNPKGNEVISWSGSCDDNKRQPDLVYLFGVGK